MSTTKKTAPVDVVRPKLLPGSDMAALHRSTGPLAEALATIPEWVEHMGHLAHLQAQRPQHRGAATLEMEAEARLIQVIESREPIDYDALTASVADAHARTTSDAAVFRAFETAAWSYSQRLDASVRENAEQIHSHLSGQLADLIDRARLNPDTLGLNAESAITSGQVEDFQAMRAQREEFHAIRSAVGRMRQRVGFNPQHPQYSELLWLSNPLEVFDRWRDWRAGARVEEQNPNSPRVIPPWPTTSGGDQEAAWFDYLVSTPDAVAWCPSEEQHDAVGDKLADHQYREWISDGSPSKRGPRSDMGAMSYGPLGVMGR